MTATKKTGPLPNAAIDFAKVHANAKAGKDDVFEGATSHVRETDPKKIAKAEAKAAEERETIPGEEGAVNARAGDEK